MKNYRVKLVFIGLAGEYSSEVIVKARNEAVAQRKAYEYVGDRSLVSMTVVGVV